MFFGGNTSGFPSAAVGLNDFQQLLSEQLWRAKNNKEVQLKYRGDLQSFLVDRYQWFVAKVNAVKCS